MTLFLLAPDPPPLAQLLNLYLPAYSCVGQAGELEAGLEAVGRLHPDVVLYHFSTPGALPWAGVFEQLQAVGVYGVIVLSELPTFAYEAFRLGAWGFALWPPDAGELEEALRRAEQRVAEKLMLQRYRAFTAPDPEKP